MNFAARRTSNLPPAILVYLSLALWLSACSPFTTAPPLPVPQTLTIGYTPAMKSWQSRLAVCADLQPEITVSLQPAGWPEPDPHAYDLLLQAAEPGADFGGYAADLGRQPIVFATFGESTQAGWTTERLQQIYTTQTQPEYDVLTYPSSSELGAIFEAAFLAGARLSPYATLASSFQDMQAMLEQIPRSIGYLPQDELGPGLRELPGAPVLSLPRVALAAAEPQGALRIFLACLQGDLAYE